MICTIQNVLIIVCLKKNVSNSLPLNIYNCSVCKLATIYWMNFERFWRFYWIPFNRSITHSHAHTGTMISTSSLCWNDICEWKRHRHNISAYATYTLLVIEIWITINESEKYWPLFWRQTKKSFFFLLVSVVVIVCLMNIYGLFAYTSIIIISFHIAVIWCIYYQCFFSPSQIGFHVNHKASDFNFWKCVFNWISNDNENVEKDNLINEIKSICAYNVC